ncbi:MAG TPA: hypothetical protein VN222_09235 [Novosphingobium sp.]|nr:hypothetical protein [Novosphingobium sp.]
MAVSAGANLFRPKTAKGSNGRLVDAMKRDNLAQAKLMKNIMDLLLAGRAQGSSAAMHLSDLLKETDLLERMLQAREGAGKALSNAAGKAAGKALERASPTVEAIFGRVAPEQKAMTASIDQAERMALADIDRKPQMTAAAADDARSDVKRRYGAIRAAATNAQEMFARMMAKWEQVASSQKIAMQARAFAEANQSKRAIILELRARQTVLAQKIVAEEGKLAPAALKALRQEASALSSQVSQLTEELSKSLRSRFATVRRDWLKAMLNDPMLKTDLAAIGIILKERPSGSVRFSLSLKSAGGRPYLIQIDVDHAHVQFAGARDAWLASGNARDLEPILAGNNMQLALKRENQQVLTILRNDAAIWTRGDRVPASIGSVAAAQNLKALEQWDNGANLLSELERSAGRALDQEERDAVRWLLDNRMF